MTKFEVYYANKKFILISVIIQPIITFFSDNGIKI